MANDKQFFSDRELTGLAEFRGLFSASKLQKLRMTGNGPRYLKLGQKVFYKPEWVRDWLAGKVVSSTSDRVA